MTGWGPLEDDAPVFVISVAAELTGMHPQTLRQYDRLGLVSPGRSAGRGRRYSSRDVAQLREVQRLSKDEGVNLAGVKRVLELENQVAALTLRVRELAAELALAQDSVHDSVKRREDEVHASYRRDLVPRPKNAGLVLWRAARDRGTSR